VAAAFEAVVGALQQKQTNILAAQAYQARKIPAAHAEAAETLGQARSDAALKVEVASAEADQFGNQMAAYRASPSVYTQRSYLETLARALAPVRKYVLGVTNTQDIIMLNLEEKIRQDLLTGVALPPDAVKPPEPRK
jgi:regulator of protease activity HflC (stomatin/prohibitin superfamily)